MWIFSLPRADSLRKFLPKGRPAVRARSLTNYGFPLDYARCPVAAVVVVVEGPIVKIHYGAREYQRPRLSFLFFTAAATLACR